MKALSVPGASPLRKETHKKYCVIYNLFHADVGRPLGLAFPSQTERKPSPQTSVSSPSASPSITIYSLFEAFALALSSVFWEWLHMVGCQYEPSPILQAT
jgi:hypothetical protein